MFPLVRKKRIYLDYAAATPVRKEVLDAMQPFWAQQFANPSAIHQEGVYARQAVENSRERIAKMLHIRSDDVLFTASGTESNNLAILGCITAAQEKGIAYTDMKIISTAIEHPSVSETLAHLATRGVTIKRVKLSETGSIDIQDLKSLLSEKVLLVTFAYVNSEVGVIQDVSKIARIVHAYDADIYVHVDAAQAPLYLPCALDRLSADMVSFDAGKCYGPKGVGVLAMRHGVSIAPHMFGGSQERGLRPGTENTPLIVGCAEALTIAQEQYEKRAQKVAAIRDYGIALLREIDGLVLNGPHDTQRVANNINVSIPGIDNEFAVISLDAAGIACSTKSACSALDGKQSGVVYTLSGDTERASSTIRFSLGEETTSADMRKIAAALAAHVQKVKKAQERLS